MRPVMLNRLRRGPYVYNLPPGFSRPYESERGLQTGTIRSDSWRRKQMHGTATPSKFPVHFKNHAMLNRANWLDIPSIHYRWVLPSKLFSFSPMPWTYLPRRVSTFIAIRVLALPSWNANIQELSTRLNAVLEGEPNHLLCPYIYL